MLKKIGIRTLLIVTLFCPVAASAALFSNLYIFGDSLSDTGNLADITTNYPPPFFNNRASNGPLGVDVLAANLGLSVNASLHLSGPAVGTNYAVVGARAGDTGAVDLPTQIAAFQNTVANSASPSALYMVFAGANDVRDATMESNNTIASQMLMAGVAGISTAVRSLAASGAQRILVPNVFDLGLIPESLTLGIAGRATFQTQTFNLALSDELLQIESDLNIDLIEFDLFTIASDLLSSGTFANTTQSCLHLILVGQCDFASFAFFDEVHPTANFHALIGNEFTTAVIPLPGSLILLMSGLAIFARRFIQRQAPGLRV